MARPDLSYLKNLALTLLGLAVGVWSGLTGMGAALVLSPMLVWSVGLRGRALGAIALTASAVAALTALTAYSQARDLSPAPALLFTAGSAVGSLVAARSGFAALRSSRTAEIGGATLAAAIGIALMIAASRTAHDAGLALAFHPPGPHLVWAFVAGILAGWFGQIGNVGGLLSAPALLLLAGESERAAQASALLSLVILSALPCLFAIVRRSAPASYVVWVAFGAALGGLVGARVALALPDMRLILIYGAGMAVAGAAKLASGPPAPSKTEALPPT